MGREQELRDAAKDGNVAKLESLLAAKKSSLMSSLRKALDINCQDENGNTALHLAALNGKRDAASILLNNDASANIPETKGNYPLHLAAFNGHHELADVLLNQGPSRADVLQQNSAEDTPLHLAAQYGHTHYVKTLLQCHADPHMRNKKGETPLDLAAMYGRLPTVQVLILSDKSLVKEQTKALSPLHLAARNGHTAVIGSLLDFGMSVNTMCDPGSALHEAALFGKVEAVKLLLKRGIDVNATNDNGDTVVDLLEDLPSERSQEITALIYEQSQQMMNSVQQRSKSMSISSQSSSGNGPTMPGDVREEQSSHFAGTRAASVSQKRSEPAYTVVNFPRISRTEQSFAEASISPLPPDGAGQEEVFDDDFLREMKVPSPTLPEVPARESILEIKAPIVRNVYEVTAPPDDADAPENQSYDVLPPRPKGDSVISQDSDPFFPPPSTEEALKTMKRYVETQSGPGKIQQNSQDRETAQRANSVEQNDISSFAKLHIKMSPKPNDVYDNVNISNRPIHSHSPDDLISWEERRPTLEQKAPTQFSPVKQSRTRSSVKEASRDGSRPTSTLNESYEWSKIDKIFSSFEDLIQTDINLDEDETLPPDSVSDWLTQLGLSYYEASFLANGYDDIAFIGGDMLDEDDLREIGIQNSDHVRKILHCAANLPSPPQIGEPGFPIPETVSEWLARINLRDYETRFNMNGYENMDRVRAIWEFELTTVIGIHLMGHRKRMIYSLGRRPEQEREQVSWSQRFADAEAPKSKQRSSGDDATDIANQLLRAAEDMAQDFGSRRNTKDPSPPQSPPQEPSQPPTPKSPTSPRILKYQPSFQWIHKPEALLYTSVFYETHYLGSHPVMVVRGTESTVDACKKMKSTSKMLQKIPTISLSISVRGIDFIDAQSRSTISSYDIRYISYCAQDPDDLSIFAYITKDAKTGKHYCHVFKGQTAAMSDEIVLTIGQAFELAYHQHRVLIEQAKEHDQGDDDKNYHEAKNELNHTSPRAERVPPPVSERKPSGKGNILRR